MDDQAKAKLIQDRFEALEQSIRELKEQQLILILGRSESHVQHEGNEIIISSSNNSNNSNNTSRNNNSSSSSNNRNNSPTNAPPESIKQPSEQMKQSPTPPTHPT